MLASYAAMIFSGDLGDFLSQGIGINLYGAVVMGVVISIFGSFIPVIASLQDVPVAVLAAIAAAIAGTMAGSSDPEGIFTTVVAAMMLSTLLTGAAFWLMGRFNLGRLVRFIPYPVIGGFLGGTGWVLLLGGIGAMTDTPLSLALLQPDVLLRWLPGFIFGAILYLLLRRFSHFLLMPALILGGIGLFYLIHILSGGSLTSAGADGWLLGPFPEGSLFQFVTVEAITNANWSVVFKNIINTSTIIFVSSISLLLNASGLEIDSGVDIDLNRELKTTGIANLLAGLGGSPAGFHTLSSSVLAQRLGANSRMVGLFFSATIAFTLFFGASVLAIFPKMIAGGLLIFLGISLLIEWIYDAWYELPKPDYLLIWLILGVIATVGFMEGVAVGILVASLLFVLNYSQVDVVRHAVNGTNFQSHVIRPRLHQQLLQQRGNSFNIFELQGFIFFGTADKLVSRIRERIEAPDKPKLQYLLLDFQLVTGIDSSAILSFSKLKKLTLNHGTTLVFTGLSPKIQDQLKKKILESGSREYLHTFPDLDQGAAWCEESIIAIFHNVGLVAKPKTILQLVEESLSDQDEEKDWLAMIAPGAKHKPSNRISRILKYLENVSTQEGDCLIMENEEIRGLYFIEDGQFIARVSSKDQADILLRILEAGTVFGEIDYYSEQFATATFECTRPGILLFLSSENLKRMEVEDPELAIAFHRVIAGILGKKLLLTSDTLRAIHR